MKRVLLPMTTDIQQRFATVHSQLNAGSKEKLAKPLGEVLADLSCEIVDRMFGDLLKKSKANAQTDQEHRMIQDSEKVIQQIIETFRKYMPYAVSLFGNERLVPLVNYLKNQMLEKNDQPYLTFNIADNLLQKALQNGGKIKSGDQASIVPAFDGLIKIIDEGVTALIREPKTILKFNFVIDKTLSGVLNMTTSLGYKRLEKLATQMDVRMANQYVEHFLGFVEA